MSDDKTMRELIDDIGVDAARFFLVQRSHETAFDLDLDVASDFLLVAATLLEIKAASLLPKEEAYFGDELDDLRRAKTILLSPSFTARLGDVIGGLSLGPKLLALRCIPVDQRLGLIDFHGG